MRRSTFADRGALVYSLLLACLAVAVSFPAVGELLFRGYFVQDADEVVRSWYGRCALQNPHIIPYSHLSMPGWALVLGIGETIGGFIGLPLTLPGRLVSVAAAGVCLLNAARWVRHMGGSDRAAVWTVAVLACSPGFFLMALTVYPEMTLLAVTVVALRLFAEDRLRATALVISWAPLLRWEGALLAGLFGAALVLKSIRRGPHAATALGLLTLPYAGYLAVAAARWGNPWTPLAWRTTKHMGAWRLWNPDVPWEQLRVGLENMATLYSPAVLILGLPVAAWALWRHRPLAVAALAFAGLDVALLAIQHDFMVYPLRVFVVPFGLGVVLLGGVAHQLGRMTRPLLWTVMAGVAFTVGATYRKVGDARLPPPGGFREEIGFHALVRSADAAAVRDFVLAQRVDYVVVNHLNANLLRADEDCRLWEQPLWIGGPRLALSRTFEPTFGLPPGDGLVVFHTLPFDTKACTQVAEFPTIRQSVWRCRSGPVGR